MAVICYDWCVNRFSPVLPPFESTALPTDAARLLDRFAGAPDPEMITAIGAAWRGSPYLRRLMQRRTDALAALLTAGPQAVIDQVLTRMADPDQPVASRLRTAKADAALAIALADLSGQWTLEQVTRALSDLADRALDVAVAAAIEERTPGAEPQGFAVLGLGKLGSHELNYSSDVDLILLHDRSQLPRRDRDDPDEAAVRIARRVVELMQTRDGDGYVFRVDLRLRPSSEVTPIVLPVEAAESYYQSEALPWERAAFIRSRACAGDIRLGERFLADIGSFVWRRSLDYSAIRDIQAISLRIRDHFDAGQAVGPGYDLKRGRGGIREVEFFAQIHQMIFGGREPALRVPATLDALTALASAGRIGADEAAVLCDGYRLLRSIEHRSQMVADEQSHLLPEAKSDGASFAAFCGFANWRALERAVSAVSVQVAARYDRLIGEANAANAPRLSPELGDLRIALGPAAPVVSARVDSWRTARYRSLRSTEAQRGFEAALPGLIAAIAGTGDPATTAARLDVFFEQLPSGAQFFELLAANPRLAVLLTRLLGVAPPLAEALSRRPALFDVMLDAGAFDPLPDAAGLASDLDAYIGRAASLEVVLDRVRRWTGERRFQIGAQLIEAAGDPLVAASDYAAVADAGLGRIADAVIADMAAVHGLVPGGRLAVLGLGRYGGSALTAGSDLDLVYLFSGDHDAESDGPRPLSASRWFNRLAQRLTAALSVPTAEGPLYEVDTRLRPSGTHGLLAVSFDSFAAYQRDEAWTWEHMALTRARMVCGAPQDRAAIEATIADVLTGPRDPEKLKQDVVEMRADMARHKPGGGFWDVKLGNGGLVDLEFIVHYLQLRERTAFSPDLRVACTALARAGHADLVEAHDLLTRLLVMLRLVGGADDDKRSEQVEALLAASLGQPDFPSVTVALKTAKSAVRSTWSAAFG